MKGMPFGSERKGYCLAKLCHNDNNNGNNNNHNNNNNNNNNDIKHKINE